MESVKLAYQVSTLHLSYVIVWVSETGVND